MSTPATSNPASSTLADAMTATAKVCGRRARRAAIAMLASGVAVALAGCAAGARADTARRGAAATPATMLAIVMRSNGGADVLKLESVPVPEPAEGQVRIRIRAAAVNPIDWKRREGRYQRPPAAGTAQPAPVPYTILGYDAAGQIDAIGPGVQGFRRGDAVYAALQRAPQGSYAQYAVVRVDDVAPKPTKASFAEAASLVTGGVTALRAISAIGGVQPGQTVLVQGGSGGVGTPLVQILKARGATVFATASARNADYLTSLGVSRVIDYTAAPFESQVRGVDVVIDAVGGETTNRSVAVLRTGGTLVSVAGRTNEKACAEAQVRCVPFAPTGATVGGELRELARLVDAGQLRTHIDRSFPLSEAAAAQQLNETGRTRGKIVLEIP